MKLLYLRAVQAAPVAPQAVVPSNSNKGDIVTNAIYGLLIKEYY